MLKTFVEQKHYLFADRAEDWKDAIQMSCKSLVADGTVDETYASQIVACVEKYGPYIVLMPGVAMPHTQENATGVKKTAVAFMKLREPVNFSDSDPDKSASVFFTLASSDHDQHMANIQKLATLLLNDELVKAIKETESPEDLLRLQERFLGI
jgi:PTS system ascorbate-specific IIA component